MKTIDNYGVELTPEQDMVFAKWRNNNNIAMNTKTPHERKNITLHWLYLHNKPTPKKCTCTECGKEFDEYVIENDCMNCNDGEDEDGECCWYCGGSGSADYTETKLCYSCSEYDD